MASYHPFTDKPEKYLKSMRIGTLRGAPEFPVYPPDSGFYKEIRTRVKQYFDDNNLDPKVRCRSSVGCRLSVDPCFH